MLIVADPFSLETQAIARIIQGAVAIDPTHIEVVVVKDYRFSAPQRVEELPTKILPMQKGIELDKHTRSTIAITLLVGATLALLAVLFHLRSARRKAFRAKLRAASVTPKQHRDLDSELMAHRQAIVQNGVMQ